MNTEQKPKRQYRKQDAKTVAEFKALAAFHGNGTAAVRAMYPTMLSPSVRAFRLVKKSKEQSTDVFIDNQLQQIGVDAVNRLGKLINSTNEAIATKNVQYTIDHIRGQATKKSIALTGRVNIQSVID